MKNEAKNSPKVKVKKTNKEKFLSFLNGVKGVLKKVKSRVGKIIPKKLIVFVMKLWNKLKSIIPKRLKKLLRSIQQRVIKFIPDKFKELSIFSKVAIAGGVGLIFLVIGFAIISLVVFMTSEIRYIAKEKQERKLLVLPELELTSASIMNGAENIKSDEVIYISFEKTPNLGLLNTEIKKNTGDDLINVDKTDDSNKVAMSREGGWEDDSDYSIDLFAENLSFLENDYKLKFSTTKSPHVIVTNYANVHNISKPLIISFNLEVFDPENQVVEGVLNFSPNIQGETEILSPSTIRFTPKNSFTTDIDYTLTIPASKIVDRDGIQMKNDYTHTFRTTKAEDQGYEDTIVKDIYDEIKPGSQDVLVLFMERDIDKQSVLDRFKLAKVKTEDNLPYDINWKTSNYEDLKEDYNFYDYGSYDENWNYIPVSNDTEYYILEIRPKFTWEPGQNYKLLVSKGVMNVGKEKIFGSYSRQINIPEHFKYRGSNIDDGLFDYENEKLISIDFNNRIFSTSELPEDMVEITNLSRPGAEVDSYVYINYSSLYIRLNDLIKEERYGIRVNGEFYDKFGVTEVFDRTYEFDVTNIKINGKINVFGNSISFVDNNADDYRILIESKYVNNIKIEVAKILPEEFIAYNKTNQDGIYNIGYIVKSWDKSFENFDTNDEVKYGNLQFQYPLQDLDDGVYIIRAFDQNKTVRDAKLVSFSKYTGVVKQDKEKSIVWFSNTQDGSPLVGKDIICGGKKIKTNNEGIAVFDGCKDDGNHDFFHSEDGSVYVSTKDYLSSGNYGYKDDRNGLRYYFYPDRMVYRSGEDVKFKVFVRDLQNHKLNIPRDNIKIIMKDPKYEIVDQGEWGITEYGTAYGEFNLKEDMKSGSYSFYIDNTNVGYIRISPYDLDNFTFSVDVEEKDNYKHTDTLNLDVDANYYFGDPLAGGEVEVNLYIRDEYINYYDDIIGEDYQNYFFSSSSSGEYSSEKVGSKTVKLDDKGKASIAVPFSLPEDLAYGSAKKLSVEIKVTDKLGLSKYDTIYKNVAPKGGVVGLKSTNTYIGLIEGDLTEFEVDAVVLGEDLKPVIGTDLEVKITRNESSQVKKRGVNGVYYWDTVTESIIESEQVLSTDENGKVNIKYTPEKEGSYYLTVKRSDNSEIYNTMYLYAYEWGGYYYYYNQDKISKMSIDTDKDEYKAGETAYLTPNVSEKSYKALITVEKDNVLSYEVVDINKGQSLDLYLTKEHEPNIYYSVFAFTPHDRGNKYIDFKVGTTELMVVPEPKEIQVDLSTDKQKYYPQDNVKLNIDLQNNKSMEYLVAVVDQAVLDLSKIDHQDGVAQDMVDEFWKLWSNKVSTYSNLSKYENKIIADKEFGNKGGSGDGAGGQSLQEEDVRKEFKIVAFWDPALYTNNGDLNVEFKVPDNLTTWNVIVIGISKDTHVAVGQKKIQVANDVSLISGVPRYLLKGDKAQIAYNAVFRDEYKNQDLGAKVEVENALINCNGEYRNDCYVDVTSDSFPLRFDVDTQEYGEAKFRIGVDKDGQILDAEERIIDVQDNKQDRHELMFGNTKTNSVQNLKYLEKENDYPVKVKIGISDNLMGDLDYFKNYFKRYQNLCSEQISTKIRGLLFYAEKNDEVKEYIEYEIHRLYEYQNVDGGWGVWKNTSTINFNTIYAYETLVYLKQYGFKIDNNVLAKAEKYILLSLTGSYRQDFPYSSAINFTSKYTRYSNPYALSVLAMNDKYDINLTNTLFDQDIDLMTLVDKIYLLKTYQHYVRSKQIGLVEKSDIKYKIEVLTRFIEVEARHLDDRTYWQNSWETNSFYYNNDIKSTAMILDVFIDVKGSDDSLIPVINYLKYEAAHNKSLGTQAMFYTAHALNKVKEVFKVDLKSADIGVLVNGESYKELNKTDDGYELVLDFTGSTTEINVEVKDQKGGLFYYQVDVEYAIPLNDIKAKEKKMTLYTEYFDINNNPVEVVDGKYQLKQGQVYKIVTTLLAKDHLTQSEIRIPMPAGLRTIDFNLNSTSEVMYKNLKEENQFWNFFNNISITDKDVVFYTGDLSYSSQMKKGVYTFVYNARANYKGEYGAPGEFMQEMYLPGRGAWQGSTYVVID